MTEYRCGRARWLLLLLFLPSSGLQAKQAVERERLGRFPWPQIGQLVGSEACGRCHSEHYRDQSSHHMALTSRLVTAETEALWFSPERLALPVDWNEATPRPKYRATAEGIRLEAQYDSNVRVDAVIGSGVHGVTPIAFEDGKKIRELRLSFSEARGGWFLTPGSEGDPDPLGTPKSEEESRDCLGCHATALAWRQNHLDASGSVFGVQCERCHGPGSAHIEAVTESAGEARIFNPGTLSPAEEVSFCTQCHRQPTDFEPLEISTLDPKLARHAGVGLMMSQCFRRSPAEQTIGCLDCHDPHTNLGKAPGAYRMACLRCHDQPGSEHRFERVSVDSDCIGCHMPKETRGFYGLAFTSHWIRVPGAPPRPDSAEAKDELEYLERLYREAISRDDLGPARRALLNVNLGEVLFAQKHPDEAYVFLKEGLRFAPTARQRLKAAAIFRQGGALDDAARTLQETIRRHPALAQAHFDLGTVLRAKGDLPAAIASYRESIALDPDSSAAYAGLGMALVDSGGGVEAIAALDRAVALAPERLETRAQLAEALRSEARLDEAIDLYRDMIDRFPQARDFPPLLNGLAWLLATHPDPARRDGDEAVRLAERAASLTRYRHPRILDTLAAAYAARGDFDLAIATITKAAEYAQASGDANLARKAGEHLVLYQRGKIPKSSEPPF